LNPPLQKNYPDTSKTVLLKKTLEIQAETQISLSNALKFIQTKDNGQAALLALYSKTN
jgi:hypothetical protein